MCLAIPRGGNAPTTADYRTAWFCILLDSPAPTTDWNSYLFTIQFCAASERTMWTGALDAEHVGDVDDRYHGTEGRPSREGRWSIRPDAIRQNPRLSGLAEIVQAVAHPVTLRIFITHKDRTCKVYDGASLEVGEYVDLHPDARYSAFPDLRVDVLSFPASEPLSGLWSHSVLPADPHALRFKPDLIRVHPNQSEANQGAAPIRTIYLGLAWSPAFETRLPNFPDAEMLACIEHLECWTTLPVLPPGEPAGWEAYALTCEVRTQGACPQLGLQQSELLASWSGPLSPTALFDEGATPITLSSAKLHDLIEVGIWASEPLPFDPLGSARGCAAP